MLDPTVAIATHEAAHAVVAGQLLRRPSSVLLIGHAGWTRWAPEEDAEYAAPDSLIATLLSGSVAQWQVGDRTALECSTADLRQVADLAAGGMFHMGQVYDPRSHWQESPDALLERATTWAWRVVTEQRFGIAAFARELLRHSGRLVAGDLDRAFEVARLAQPGVRAARDRDLRRQMLRRRLFEESVAGWGDDLPPDIRNVWQRRAWQQAGDQALNVYPH